ncbi:MAG: hypothetical protein AAB506_00025 [Patescibacteria group bacterium]
MLKKIFPYLIILIFLLPLLFPLFQKGFFLSDDGEWMVIRLSAFHETLKTGQFPVRFLERLNHGYGYPVLNFLYPLPFYIGEAIHLLGFSFADSVKILFGASWILGAIFMGMLAGPVAAIVYSYLPYRIFDVYTRGSLGESFAFIWPPLIFYLLNKFFGNKRLKYLSLAALSTAALIISHNVIALLFTPVIFIYIVLKNWKLRDWKLVFGFWFLVFGASAWFWFPAIYDLQYTRAAQVAVSDFSQYFLNRHLLGLAIPLILFIALKIKRPFFVIVSLVALFLTLPQSSFIWQNTPFPKLIQFPWRILSVVVFASAVLSGYLVKINKFFALILILVVVNGLLVLKFNPVERPAGFYETNDDTTTVKNEYMPKWVKVDPKNRAIEKLTVYFPGHVVTDFDNNGIIKSNQPVKFAETPPRLAADIVSIIVVILCLSLLLF